MEPWRRRHQVRRDWRGARRGKRQVQESIFEMRDKEDVPIQSQKKTKFGLAMESFQKVLVTSIWIIPTKVDDATIDVQEFRSPQQKC